MGLKGCDLLTVPLCLEHHRELHDTGAVKPYEPSEMPVLLWQAVAMCLRERVLDKETA